jgi:hypothetical protein
LTGQQVAQLLVGHVVTEELRRVGDLVRGQLSRNLGRLDPEAVPLGGVFGLGSLQLDGLQSPLQYAVLARQGGDDRGHARLLLGLVLKDGGNRLTEDRALSLAWGEGRDDVDVEGLRPAVADLDAEPLGEASPGDAKAQERRQVVRDLERLRDGEHPIRLPRGEEVNREGRHRAPAVERQGLFPLGPGPLRRTRVRFGPLLGLAFLAIPVWVVELRPARQGLGDRPPAVVLALPLAAGQPALGEQVGDPLFVRPAPEGEVIAQGEVGLALGVEGRPVPGPEFPEALPVLGAAGLLDGGAGLRIALQMIPTPSPCGRNWPLPSGGGLEPRPRGPRCHTR